MQLRETPKASSATAIRAEIERPILVSEIIERDGSRSIHFRVFCTRREASVSLDTCRACPALREVTGESSGNGAWVRCCPQVPDATADPSLEGGPAGAVLKASVSAVRDDLAVERLRAHFVEHLVSSIYVVDASGRLIGIVRDVDLLVSRHRGRPIADRLESCALDGAAVAGSAERETAVQVMSPTPSVREDTGVRGALLEMARANQRRTAVVASDGVLLGVLGDVAGLRWLVGRRDE